MESRSRVVELRAQRRSQGGDVSGRHRRTAWSLPAFATFVTFAFVTVSLAPPFPDARAGTLSHPPGELSSQSLSVEGAYAHGAIRDQYTVTEPPPPAPALPAAGIPDPGSAKAIAYAMLQARGYGDDQYNCLVALWERESNWNVNAHNPSSGAHGIPQALPGEKMASAGADWATNPATQITWGLGYIEGRYGDPCGAWAVSEAQGWY